MSQPRHPFEMLQDLIDDDWDRDALCAQADPDKWFPEGRGNYFLRDIRAICVTCPVIRQCAQRALAGNEEHGMWAGWNAGSHERERTLAAWRAISEGVAA